MYQNRFIITYMIPGFYPFNTFGIITFGELGASS